MTDAARLAGLVASRICHDLISPVGAVGNGLELMRGAGEDAGDGDARALVEESAAAAADALRLLRLAFGAEEGRGEARREEIEAAARGHFARRRLALDWRLAPESLPPGLARPLLLLALAAAAAAPRGGTLVLTRAEAAPLALEWRIDADPPRPPESLLGFLSGSGGEASPREAHLLLLDLLAREAGARLYWSGPDRIGLA